MFNEIITIGICNFNTTDLTNACIKSIIKHLKSFSYNIIILDNSDIYPFALNYNYKNVRIINNTNQKYIKFDTIINQHGGNTVNNYANLKHAASIQFLLNICPTKYFILFDSDILLKNDINFISNDIITCANIQNEYSIKSENKYITRNKRFIPFIQFFNIELLNYYKIKYLDINRIMGTKYKNSIQFDTGSSFYIDIINNNIKYKKIDHTQYIEHLMGSSWAKIHDEKTFLDKYTYLYT